MPVISRNIRYLPYRGMSAWRKLAVAGWSNSKDASFHGWVDFDASGIRKALARFQQEGRKISPTTIAAKGIAIAISAYPKVNGVIRFGRIYQRESIDIFLQVAPDESGDNLTGIVIKNCDQKPLDQINDEIKNKSGKIRKGEDDFAGFSKLTRFLPTFVIALVQRMASFILYKLNIWSPVFGVPQDAFGSAMVTSVGMLGIQRGLAPLIPYVPCPIIVTIGKLEEKPVIKNGKVEIAEVLPLCATMDHRLIDGVGAAKMFKALTEFLQEPY